MKKFVSIVLAMVLVLSMSVVAFADETLFEHEVLFPEDNGWWKEDLDLANNADFMTALKTEGAKVVIKADAIVADGADKHGFQYGIQENTDPWASVLCHFNFAGGEGALAADSAVVEGDYGYVTFDAAAFLAACEANNINLENWKWINGACEGAKTYSISVIIPDAPAAETPADDTTAPAEDTTAPAEDTTAPAAETSEPAETGIVLALLPMAVAAAAIVVSKRK